MPSVVQPVGGLVEDQHAGVAEQRGGDAQALHHAQGEGFGPFAGDRGQTDQVENLGDPAPADAVALRQVQQMVVCGAPAVHRPGLQQRSDLAQRCRQPAVGPAVDARLTAGGRVQAEDQAHGGGLAGAVGSEEPGDPAGPDLERQPINGELGTVAFGQVPNFDHGDDGTQGRRRRNPPGGDGHYTAGSSAGRWAGQVAAPPTRARPVS